MGITIHYRGKLDNTELTNTVIEELTEISKELEWKHNLIDDKDLNIKGIITTPHTNSEGLSFLFDKNGELKNFLVLSNIDMAGIDDSHSFVKTQFTPIDVHITIVKLLKYIKQKYINNLAVTDEGDYWESEDKLLLKEKFDFLNKKMDEFKNTLRDIPADKNETIDSIADKIELIFNKLNDRKN